MRLTSEPCAGLSHDQPRMRMLRRQFPTIPGHGPAAIVDPSRRLGPIQSQVP